MATEEKFQTALRYYISYNCGLTISIHICVAPIAVILLN